MPNYLVVGSHPWNKHSFRDNLRHLNGSWCYVETYEKLIEKAAELNPRYIFFVHWSEYVPKEIFERYECVVMHPTPLPFGRGGTPIQNMIVRGYTETQITAFKMTKDIDAGPIYYTLPLSLRGSLREIFKREMSGVERMVAHIIKHEPEPTPQEGDVTYFERRTPTDSEITVEMSVSQLYDHIRMLDASGYPPATLSGDHVVVEFRSARFWGEELKAEVIIRGKDERT